MKIRVSVHKVYFDILNFTFLANALHLGTSKVTRVINKIPGIELFIVETNNI